MSDVAQPDNQQHETQPETQEAENPTPAVETNAEVAEVAEVNDTPSVAAAEASAPETVETASTENSTESSSETTETASAEEHAETPAAASEAEPEPVAAASQPAPSHDDSDSIFASDTSIPHESAEAHETPEAAAASSQADGDPGKPEAAKEQDSPITIPPEVLAECKAKTLGRLLEESQRKSTYVTNLISLLEEGTPISFIAHYRKELTGSMDEPTIRELKERYETLFELELRKQAILVTIGALGKMTPELEQKVREAVGRTELDDLYLPFRPKRKNRATVAKGKGLEPLAARIFETKGDCEPRRSQ